MKKILIILFILVITLLNAGIKDYESEFGFPMDKPRHGRYYFLKELLSIDRDPQIMTFIPGDIAPVDQELIEQNEPTELDKTELSDSSLVLDVNALSDLDMFNSLKLKDNFAEYENINFNASDYEFTFAEPADYNLYSRMQIPQQQMRQEKDVQIIPLTDQSENERRMISTTINGLAVQIDDIFLNTNKVLPQYGSIEFTLIISAEGILEADYNIAPDSRFSDMFLRETLELINSWQISSNTKLKFSFSKNYLNRP